MTTRRWLGLLALLLAALAPPRAARAELDLSRAEVVRLDNGLTIILLEERGFPVVSVQTVYRSGSRDESAGRTGLAHFLEHLAFRASASFPNGAATDAIYDAGGEWHGYTWLDLTSYYATMPTARDLGRGPAGNAGLDLLLRIEADRMARVTIDPAAIEAERGAVLAEMHGYENDPASVLFDAVAAAAFAGHPYGGNTIGSESDVAALTAGQARAFYQAHYAPANAVLAIVGDVAPAEAMALVRRHFGPLPARPAPAPARAAAAGPPPPGERRVLLAGPAERRHFELAYPAPAAANPDFPAFLVLQQLLSGGAGVNFRQNDWGTPAAAGSALHDAAEDLASWFIPTEEPYLLTVTGTIGADADPAALEAGLERRIARLRQTPPAEAELAAARAAVAEQLIFDVETTEDAAHQLAFFAGLGAYDALLALPGRVRAVTAADVLRLARLYLAPDRRTIGWYMPAEPAAAPDRGADAPTPTADRPAPPPSPFLPGTGRGTAPRSGVGEGPPQLRRLSGGLPAIVQVSPLSPTATVTVLLTAPVAGEDAPADLPGLGSITRSGLAPALPELIAAARAAMAANPPRNGEGDRAQRGGGVPPAGPPAPPSDDPETRLEQMIAAEIGAPSAAVPAPIVAVVSGAIEPEAAFAALDQAFGNIEPASPPRIATAAIAAEPRLRTVTSRIERPRPQAALGYVVDAPPPATREGLAWRMLLYILTHDYGGRLGNSAIRDRGLVYHIASAYRTDGANGWTTLATGVDPARLDAMEAMLRAELARLAADPPTEAEMAAARNHLLGRDLSAAQSNPELAHRLARQYVETGGLRSHAVLADLLEGIGPADLLAATPAFSDGTIVKVDVGSPGATAE